MVGGRGGAEGVVGRTQVERGDGPRVALEVAQVLVVVRGQVADGVVRLGRGVDDGLRVVREARQVAAVFLRQQRLLRPPFAAVVQLQRLVRQRRQQEVAAVVEVERGRRRVGLGELELLVDCELPTVWFAGLGLSTFAGLKWPMMSESFWLGWAGAPPGGGGGGFPDMVAMREVKTMGAKNNEGLVPSP